MSDALYEAAREGIRARLLARMKPAQVEAPVEPEAPTPEPELTQEELSMVGASLGLK